MDLSEHSYRICGVIGLPAYKVYSEQASSVHLRHLCSLTEVLEQA